MREDTSLVLLTPSETQHLTLIQSQWAQGFLQDLDFIPPEMLPGMKPLLYPIEDYVADLMMLPNYVITEAALDVYKADQVSHIAMLSLEHEGPSWRFGGDRVRLGYLLYWSAPMGKYKLMHCPQCAQCAAGWLYDMQAEWGQDHALGQDFQKNGKTYH